MEVKKDSVVASDDVGTESNGSGADGGEKAKYKCPYIDIDINFHIDIDFDIDFYIDIDI